MFDVVAPAGGDCNAGACWKPVTNGVRYRDRNGSEGTVKLMLRAGVEIGQVGMRARGERLPPLPALPLSLPVTTQLRNATGACWEAVFTSAGVLTNGPADFVAIAETP